MSAPPGRPLAGLAPPWSGPGPEPGDRVRRLSGVPADAGRRLRSAAVLLVSDPDEGDGARSWADAVETALAEVGVARESVHRAARESAAEAIDPVDLVIDLLPDAEPALTSRAAAVARPVLWARSGGGAVEVGVGWPPHSPCRFCAEPGSGVVDPGPSAPPVQAWATAVIVAEAVKALVGFGDLALGRTLGFDAWGARIHERVVTVDPRCPRCGDGVAGEAPAGTSAPVRSAPDVAAAVVALVPRIPAGSVLSYGDIARLIGVGSARQVGQVMAAGVGSAPWWRVVRADGGLPPGLEGEAAGRLRAEGTPMRGETRVDMARARWSDPTVGGA